MFTRSLIILTLATGLAGCGLDHQAAPSLAGPSEFGTSISITATPDTLLQNGTAQSVIEILARDGAGRAVSGQVFYIQTRVGNALNIGTLSASSVVTNSQGRASVVFTAPAAGAAITTVTVDVIPTGTNANNNLTRTIAIRLIAAS